MFSGLSRLRLLSVLLTLVLVAPPLGGSLSARPAASSQPSGTPNSLHGVACSRPSTCVAVGWDGTIVRSTDGGRTWRRQPSGSTRYELLGVACARPSTCVAVGQIPQDVGREGIISKGTILRSTNGGRTWHSQPSATPNAWLVGVACPRPSTCVALGNITEESPSRGTILRSTDGGRTWRSVSPGDIAR